MQYNLWLGSYMDDSVERQLKNEINYQKPSTVISQRNILEGLETVTGHCFDSIGAVVMPGFPRDKSLVVPSCLFERPDGKKGVLIGYPNILYLNKFITIFQMKNAVRKWLNEHPDAEHVDVFIYEIRSACIEAAVFLKHKLPNTKIHLIVPDLPGYMDLHMSCVKKYLKELDYKKIKVLLPQVDDFFLYTAPMAEYLGVENRPWMVMEGSINLSSSNFSIAEVTPAPANTLSGKRIIMYSGSVDTRFGIMNLIEAVRQLSDRYELWITGGGPDSNLVKAEADNCNFIRYYGFLPEQKDVLRLQTQATVLVNMRDPKEVASKYCFPSKMFEYMMTGKPVLSCRLGGIPEEYYQYLLEMKSLDPSDIVNAISALDQMDAQKLSALGRTAQTFIAEEKNNVKQAKKMVDWLEAL